MPVTTKPIRLTHISATLMDHIYTNNITSLSKSCIIITDMADNFWVLHISETPPIHSLPNMYVNAHLKNKILRSAGNYLKDVIFLIFIRMIILMKRTILC